MVIFSCGHEVLSVRPSVGTSVHWSVMIELKSAKPRISDAAVVIVCVCECVWGGREWEWGLHTPSRLSATIL